MIERTTRRLVDDGHGRTADTRDDTPPIEPLTVEDIRRDAWSAVNLELPDVAGIDLLDVIVETARALSVKTAERALLAQTIEEGAAWHALSQQAGERVVDALSRLHKAPEAVQAPPARDSLEVWETWQQREFSAASIRTDPWTAVYLQIPEDADASLLAAAQVAAVTCIGMIELGENWYRPRVPQGDGPAENQAKASSRLDELDTHLALLTAKDPERISLVAVQDAAPTSGTPRAETRDEIELPVQQACAENDRYLQIILGASEPAASADARESPQNEQRRGRRL